MSLAFDATVRRGSFEARAEFGAEAGQTVALLGPNGAGKSTVVSALAGLTPPAAGRIALGGEDLDDAGRGIHVPPGDRRVGVLFQDRLLFPHLSALENAAFPLRARGVSQAEARARAAALLQRLGVGSRAHARPRDLSGGEAQQVALARALAGDPRLLLLDEPLSALDVSARSRIRSLIRTTLASFDGVRLLVTHDPVEAMTLADRLVLMEAGRITQIGTPQQIREAPRTPYAADLVGVNLFSGRLEPIEEGAGRLVTSEGAVVVAWPAEAGTGPVEGVLALLPPADVALALGRPEGSPRNVLEGPIAAVSLEGERARIRLATSPPLVAEVTLGSVERLALAEGARVWASFKAVEVRVLLP